MITARHFSESAIRMKIVREIFRPMPRVLYLEPFFGCNYRCRFCIHGIGLETRNVSLDPSTFDRLKPVIEKASHVHMTGFGEPFLNPHLPDYLSYFKQKGKSYYINTNGSLLDDALVELMTKSPSELSVSLDAGDEETYDKIRCGGSWGRVLANVKKVSHIKAERGSPYPLLYVSFHINALNLMSLKNIPQLAGELGVSAVKLSWTRLPEAHRVHSIFRDQDKVNNLIRAVSKELNDSGIHMRNEAAFGKHVRGCWHFTDMTFVGANATVAACCSRWVSIGNLHDNSFEDIWNGTRPRKIALGILNGSPDAACANCQQIYGADYSQNEEDFLKPENADLAILAEKTKSIEKLPSLEGLDVAFAMGANAFLEGNLQAAASIFAALETKFPDFFEIKNNLAAAHFYLGNIDKSREVLRSMKRVPHNQKLVQWNIEFLQKF
jgi:MoaA/NifB/PqqE/SkfB family radical SAM enzyme